MRAFKPYIFLNELLITYFAIFFNFESVSAVYNSHVLLYLMQILELVQYIIFQNGVYTWLTLVVEYFLHKIVSSTVNNLAICFESEFIKVNLNIMLKNSTEWYFWLVWKIFVLSFIIIFITHVHSQFDHFLESSLK